MRTNLSLILSLLMLPGLLAADEPTWLEIDGVIMEPSPTSAGRLAAARAMQTSSPAATTRQRTSTPCSTHCPRRKKGQVVFIPGDTEIDLTARIYIEQLVLEVPAGVTLAGDRGHNGSPGALLASDALKTPMMIRATGPNVRITGLRIRGPNPKRYLDHHRRSFGQGGGRARVLLQVPHPRRHHDRSTIGSKSTTARSPASATPASACEGRGHHIHHYFIHHCQYNGLGYGVSHDTASSLIEFNLFDWNRHSIAGTGRPGCGYVARHNVELGTSLSHCFDMHGGRDRKDGTDIAGTRSRSTTTRSAPRRRRS